MDHNCYQPYIFQSGKYQGRSVEEIIFKDPTYIGILLEYKNKNKASNNALYQHLEVLMSSFPKTASKCPVCHRESVKYFLYLNTETVSRDLICCDSPYCKARIVDNHPNDYLIPLNLSSLLIFKKKTLRKKVITLFKSIIGIRGLKTNEIFNIFFADLPIREQSVQLDIKF